MNEEILKIQKMVSSGKISPEEGARLIEALISQISVKNESSLEYSANPQTVTPHSNQTPLFYIAAGLLAGLGLIAWVSAYFDTETHNLIRSGQGWRVLCILSGFLFLAIGYAMTRIQTKVNN